MTDRRSAWVPEREAGRGGMAVVWSAHERASGLRVALKVVPDLVGDTAPAFLSEVRAVASLHHPNIVRVFDLGVVDDALAEGSGGELPVGAPFLVMEWVGGGILRPYDRWEPLRDALRVLLHALAHAHARGVIHRDLKPGNVLLGGPGDLRPGLRLVDFGLARIRGATEAEPLRGTPRYMAPEQVTGGSEGPWTDLYALGALAWELTCGHAAHPGADDAAVLRARLHGAHRPFEPAIPVPRGLEAWLLRLLAHWPEERPPSAGEALRALDALGPAEPTAVAPSPAPSGAPPTLTATLTLADLEELRRTAPAAPPLPPVPLAGRGDPSPPTPPPRAAPPVPERWAPEPADAGWLGITGVRLFGLREGPLSGREAERQVLWDALRATTSDASTRAVVLRGPVGLGKTRLARWLTEAVAEQSLGLVATLASARPPAREEGLPELVARALRLPDAPVARALAVDRHPEAAALARALAPEGPLAGRLAATARVLRAEADARALVVWLDDAVWSPTALALADLLLRGGVAGPTLVLLTIPDEALPERPEARALLDRILAHPATTSLPVGPLDEEAMNTLLSGLVRLDPVTARFLVTGAAGNPLLALRLVEGWIARDMLLPTPRGLGLAALPPPGQIELRDVLADELDELIRAAPAREAESIERAAVLGDRVNRSEWRAACAQDGLPDPRWLERELLDRGVLRSTPDGLQFLQGLFRFALLRRAARERRLEPHHAAVAATLEAAAPLPAESRTTSLLARIGEHWLAAGRPERAIAPLLAALERRHASSALAEAGVLLRLLRAALDGAHVPRDDARWGPFLAGRLWHEGASSGPAAAVAAARELEEWATRVGDVELLLEARCRGVYARGQLGQAPDALPILGDAWAVARLRTNAATTCLIGELYIVELRNRGAFAEAIEVAQEMLRAAKAHGTPLHAGASWRNLGVLYRMTRRDAEAVRAFEAARALLPADTWPHAETLNNLGDLLRDQGDLPGAAALYLEAAEGFRAAGSFDACVAELNLASTRLLERRFDEAEALIQRVIVDLTRLGSTRFVDLARAVRLPALARRVDVETFHAEMTTTRAALEAVGFVEPDIAMALELAAEQAGLRGWSLARRDALRWSHAQWTALGRHADAERVRGLEG